MFLLVFSQNTQNGDKKRTSKVARCGRLLLSSPLPPLIIFITVSSRQPYFARASAERGAQRRDRYIFHPCASRKTPHFQPCGGGRRGGLFVNVNGCEELLLLHCSDAINWPSMGGPLPPRCSQKNQEPSLAAAACSGFPSLSLSLYRSRLYLCPPFLMICT